MEISHSFHRVSCEPTKTLWKLCAFSENSHTRKPEQIAVFYEVYSRLHKKNCLCSPIFFQSDGAKNIMQKCYMNERKFKCLLALKSDNHDKCYHSAFHTRCCGKYVELYEVHRNVLDGFRFRIRKQSKSHL